MLINELIIVCLSKDVPYKIFLLNVKI